jgi:hypothetical protein
MPPFLQKLLFVVGLGLFGLLLGALLGGTVFSSSSGHGLGSLASMISGALIGLGASMASAVILVVRARPLPWGWLALGTGIGSGLVIGLILLLDVLGQW